MSNPKSIRAAKYYEQNRARLLARCKEYYYQNKERKKIYDLEYYKQNKPLKDQQSVLWVSSNRDKRRVISKRYAHNNRHKCLHQYALRRARKKNACPLWLTKEQKQAILDIYKGRPEGYHVDHIIPLGGKNVSGLHVPWNLQYLLAEENFKKGAKCA